MATFITRVELHDATYQDYVKLHGYMGQEGFTTTIRGDDGGTYQLPPAEYHLAASCTVAQARDKASAAAQKTNKKFAVIASEYTSAAWVGLARAQARVA
jgi:hypothetical protein